MKYTKVYLSILVYTLVSLTIVSAADLGIDSPQLPRLEAKKDLRAEILAQAGNVSGSGANEEIAVFNSTSTVRSYPTFIFDDELVQLGVGRSPSVMGDFYQVDETQHVMLLSFNYPGGQSTRHFLGMQNIGEASFVHSFWPDGGVDLANIADGNNYSQVGIGIDEDAITQTAKVAVKSFGLTNTSYPLILLNKNGNLIHMFTDDGRLGLGGVVPQAYLHLPSGSDTASSLKFNGEADENVYASGGEVDYLTSTGRLKLHNGTAWNYLATTSDNITQTVVIPEVPFANNSANIFIKAGFANTTNLSGFLVVNNTAIRMGDRAAGVLGRERVAINNSIDGVDTLKIQGFSSGGNNLERPLAIYNAAGKKIAAIQGTSTEAFQNDYGVFDVIGNTSGTGQIQGDFQWYDDAITSSSDKRGSVLRCFNDGAAFQSSCKWVMRKTNAGFLDNVMVFKYDGRIGVGVAAPSANLSVLGNLTTTTEAKIGTNLFAQNVTATTYVTAKSLRVQNATNSGTDRCVLAGSGTCTIANTRVTNDTNIFCFNQQDSGGIGTLYIDSRNSGVNYTVSSTDISDTSIVGCVLIEPIQVI